MPAGRVGYNETGDVRGWFAALWSAVIALLLRAFREPHRRQVLVLLGSVVGVVLVGAGLFALAEDVRGRRNPEGSHHAQHVPEAARPAGAH
jgi:hypothetical protein